MVKKAAKSAAYTPEKTQYFLLSGPDGGDHESEPAEEAEMTGGTGRSTTS